MHERLENKSSSHMPKVWIGELVNGVLWVQHFPLCRITLQFHICVEKFYQTHILSGWMINEWEFRKRQNAEFQPKWERLHSHLDPLNFSISNSEESIVAKLGAMNLQSILSKALLFGSMLNTMDFFWNFCLKCAM